MSSKARKKTTRPLRDRALKAIAPAVDPPAPALTAPPAPALTAVQRGTLAHAPINLARAPHVLPLTLTRENRVDGLLTMAWAMVKDQALPVIADEFFHLVDSDRGRYETRGRPGRAWERITCVEVERALQGALRTHVSVRADLRVDLRRGIASIEIRVLGRAVCEDFDYRVLQEARRRDEYGMRSRYDDPRRSHHPYYDRAELSRAINDDSTFARGFAEECASYPDIIDERPLDRLVRICRVIANAQALELAAALSLRGVYWAPKAIYAIGARFVGHCATHGLIRDSDYSRIGPPVGCPRCDQARDAVGLLVGVIHGALAAWAEARRLAVDGLVSVCRQAAAVLWESLDDASKRYALLETDGPRALAPALSPDNDDFTVRCTLLEMGDPDPVSAPSRAPPPPPPAASYAPPPDDLRALRAALGA